MSKVYLVSAGEGSYEDAREWSVAAFSDLSRAREWCATAQTRRKAKEERFHLDMDEGENAGDEQAVLDAYTAAHKRACKPDPWDCGRGGEELFTLGRKYAIVTVDIDPERPGRKGRT